MTSFASAGVGTWLAVAIAGVVLPWGLLRWRRSRDTGAQRFFRSQTCHFQTLRVFNDISAGGADTGEILQVIRTIRSGDGQSWYTGWEAAATRELALTNHSKDSRSRGAALHRGHNYLPTAQFLLPPEDPKRPAAFERDRAAFYSGLQGQGGARPRPGVGPCERRMGDGRTRGLIKTARAFDSYTLAGGAHRINCDVLILAGSAGPLRPAVAGADFERALTSARSVTNCVCDGASGGAEHCQLGALTLWHQDFFDWVEARFDKPE